MLRGINELNIDEKGRLAVPSRYREPLKESDEGKLVVTIDVNDPCLLIYPLSDWEKLEKQIESLPSFNKAARRVQRLLLGHATDVSLDGHGRLVIPPPLRDYAHLDKKAVLIGQGKKFELWSGAKWAGARESWLMEEAEQGQLPDSLQTLSL